MVHPAMWQRPITPNVGEPGGVVASAQIIILRLCPTLIVLIGMAGLAGCRPPRNIR
jgi:hypothetical protein